LITEDNVHLSFFDFIAAGQIKMHKFKVIYLKRRNNVYFNDRSYYPNSNSMDMGIRRYFKIPVSKFNDTITLDNFHFSFPHFGIHSLFSIWEKINCE